MKVEARDLMESRGEGEGREKERHRDRDRETKRAIPFLTPQVFNHLRNKAQKPVRERP